MPLPSAQLRYARAEGVKAAPCATFQSRARGQIHALLVDPSLFTAPYDAALAAGLAAWDVSTLWATRSPRPGESCEIPPELVAPIYYPKLEASAKRAGPGTQIRKGGSHLASTRRLLRLREREACDIVHFQWLLLPPADLLAIRRLRRRVPVVLTVHDTTPFNGNPTSRLQLLGFHSVLQAVDHLVVHTCRGRDVLVAAGVASGRISVIPHGPLTLEAPRDAVRGPRECDPRWTFVLFGRLQDYKGADVLLEGLAAIGPETRAGMRVIVAGEPFVDIAALQRRAADLGVAEAVEWRLGRLTEAEMAALFDEADTFLFPYRRIEASGVYYLVKGLGKWIVASDLGAFGEEVTNRTGHLIPPADAPALASAMADAVGRRPDPLEAAGPSWETIGGELAGLYRRLLDRRAT